MLDNYVEIRNLVNQIEQMENKYNGIGALISRTQIANNEYLIIDSIESIIGEIYYVNDKLKTVVNSEEILHIAK